MKFPEKYIKRGNFKLHSGQSSDIFYDVNEMLTDDFYMMQILDNIPLNNHYIGIATGGAIIARLISSERKSKFSMIKDGVLKGDSPSGDWILIDDMVTTGSANENPKIDSIFEL